MTHAATRRHPDEYLGPRATLIGRSPAIRSIRRTIGRLAQLDTPVLITGESGTGKRLAAHAIATAASGARRRIFENDIAPFSEAILEIEVFGSERGAYPGARQSQGLLEVANGCTVCLRNFDCWPHRLQPGLLRVLHDGVTIRRGGDRPIPVDVRLIVLTGVQPEILVNRGVLSDGLARAVNAERLHIPPLRERVKDIPVLARHFARMYGKAFRCRPLRFTADALSRLQRYRWPGNVRELSNVVERVYAVWHFPTMRKRRGGLPDKRTIALEDLPGDIAHSS